MSAATLSDAVRALESIAPLSGAAAWDNVGLLVEPLCDGSAERILLCIDLTEAVMAEASSWGACLVVAYHPPLFTGVQRLTQSVPLERSILRAVREGIAIYSPHTALDAAVDGVCDWLARGLGPLADSRPIEPVDPSGDEGVGAGRLVTLAEPATVQSLVDRTKAHLGLGAVRVAGASDALVRTVALCPGAGGSLFANVGEADLFLTGEMRHHDVLARTALGSSVILTDHTHSERGYLPHLQARLAAALQGGAELRISTEDVEPLRIV